MDQKAWYKLDNAAKIYPPTSTRRWQSMFRMSVTLVEEVDVDLLAKAQERALERFPVFACRLRAGLFWYYLEHIEGAPPIVSDTRNPMRPLDAKANGGFMYRLCVRGRRIAIEFFHTVADGTGAMTFLLSLANEYLRLAHGVDASPAKYILSCDDDPKPQEMEDAFLRYAGTEPDNRAEERAYQPRGSLVPGGRVLFVSGTVPTEALREKAGEYGVSVGVFLSSLLIWAVHQEQLSSERPGSRRRKQPVKLCLPINLRQFFPSATLRNFSAFFNPGIESRFGEYSFEEILTQMKHFMGMRVNERALAAWMAYNVGAERNPVIRAVPLFVKKLILKVVFRVQGDNYSSTTLSNFGLVKLPDEMAAYVDRIDFFLGPASRPRCQCGCVSFGGRTFIDFSRTFAQAGIERRFFSELVRMGVAVEVEGNER